MKRSSFSKKKKQDSPRSIILVLCLCVLCLTIFGLLLHDRSASLPVLPAAIGAAVFPEPSENPATPVPGTTEAPVKKSSLYPEGAIDVFSDGTLLFTVDNRRTAKNVFSEYLSVFAALPLNENESLIRASVSNEITVSVANGNGVYMSQEEALEYLLDHPELVSVRRVTKQSSIALQDIPGSQYDNPALPAGTRIIRAAAHPASSLTQTENTYEGTVLAESSEKSGFRIGNTATGTITETGTGGNVPLPDNVPRLRPPVKGTVVRDFGTDENGVSYGLSYRSETGYNVYAPGEGTVIFCGQRGAMGTVIEIEHGDSGFVSRVIGLTDVRVRLGDTVERGDCIGTMPFLFAKQKPVLRYELLIEGIPADPADYLL